MAYLLITGIALILGFLAYKYELLLVKNESILETYNEQLEKELEERTEELRKQKQQLEDSEFRWKFAVDGSGNGLWDWNIKTNEVYFSKGWKEMLGFEDDEIKGSLDEWEKRVHPDDLERVYIDIQNHLDGKTELYLNEHRVKCKDGSYKWIQDRGVVAQRDENGDVVRLLGTHSDITSRKDDEFKMKQALTVFENTNEGIMITNAKNQIINVNPAFCKVTGYSYLEVIGKNPSILKSFTKDNKYYKKMWEDIRVNGFWQGEIVNRNKKGLLYDEFLSINTVRNSDGSVNSYIGIFSDISLLKQQEKMILQQARTSAIGEMIANIAHQWRQPLSAISTVATGMKVQLELGMTIPKDDEIINLDKINQQTQHLSKTIDDFRGFFSGNMSEMLEFEVSDVVKQVHELSKDSFKINFVEMIYDIDKDLYLYGNKNLLIQALLNIYNNALDALKQVEDEKFIFISLKKDEDKILLSIKDNAGGIAEDILEKVFEPYFTTKHQSQGTGIGLYMTHQIVVKQLNASISAINTEYSFRNKSYKGALFTITL